MFEFSHLSCSGTVFVAAVCIGLFDIPGSVYAESAAAVGSEIDAAGDPKPEKGGAVNDKETALHPEMMHSDGQHADFLIVPKKSAEHKLTTTRPAIGNYAEYLANTEKDGDKIESDEGFLTVKMPAGKENAAKGDRPEIGNFAAYVVKSEKLEEAFDNKSTRVFVNKEVLSQGEDDETSAAEKDDYAMYSVKKAAPENSADAERPIISNYAGYLAKNDGDFDMNDAGISAHTEDDTAGVRESNWVLSFAAGYHCFWFSAHGASLMFSFGYRFKSWFSLELDQSIMAGSESERYSDPYREVNWNEPSRYLMGSTAVSVKFIYAHEKHGDFYLKLTPLGIIYFDNIDSSSYLFTAGAGIGYTYFFSDEIGLGGNVEARYPDGMTFQLQLVYLF